MSDTQFLIGKLVEGHGDPDAIHVAIMPATAAKSLKPGQHVGFDKGGYSVTDKPQEPYRLIGIIDPFLAGDVAKGQRCYVLLYPNTITGLRHVWSHPSILSDGVGVGSESEKWLRDFAVQVNADYHDMMQVAASHCGEDKWGDYLIEGGKWEGQSTPPEFWEHYEAVTGKKPNSKYGPPGIFSCSC